MGVVAGVLAALVAILVAAKSHGRQVRLERELAGYAHVVFGGTNPAGVEAIWRRDRWAFWTTLPLSAGVAGAGLHALDAGTGAMVVGGLALGAVGAFGVAGLASWWRAARKAPPGDGAWRRAQRGSLAWWTATLGAATLLGLALAS